MTDYTIDNVTNEELDAIKDWILEHESNNDDGLPASDYIVNHFIAEHLNSNQFAYYHCITQDEYGIDSKYSKHLTIKRMCKEWLMGLALSIPFADYDILNLAGSWDILDRVEPNTNDMKVRAYWDLCANAMYSLLPETIQCGIF